MLRGSAKKKSFKKEIPGRHHRLLLPAPGSALGHVQLTESSALSWVAGIRKERASPSQSLCHRHSGAPGSQEPRPPHSHSAQSVRGSDKGKGDSTIPSKEKTGPERCSILPQVTQLLSGRAGLRHQVRCRPQLWGPWRLQRVPGWEVWGVLGRVGGRQGFVQEQGGGE